MQHLLHLPNARSLDDFLLICGQPTAEQLREASEFGVKQVISLCDAKECPYDEAAVAQSLGLDFISLPVVLPHGVNEANARLLQKAMHQGPTLIHCSTGNRAAALMALRAYHCHGHDANTALMHGQNAGLTKLEPLVRQHLGLPED